MNRLTAELILQLKQLLELRKNLEEFAKSKQEYIDRIDKLAGLLDYEAIRLINDILHNEKAA